MTIAAETYREACAREIDMMVRAHVAHEAAALIPVRDYIRAMPLIDDLEATIIAAADICFDARDTQTLSDYQMLMNRAGMRIFTEIDRKDPMSVYSDAAKWWPRKAA